MGARRERTTKGGVSEAGRSALSIEAGGGGAANRNRSRAYAVDRGHDHNEKVEIIGPKGDVGGGKGVGKCRGVQTELEKSREEWEMQKVKAGQPPGEVP